MLKGLKVLDVASFIAGPAAATVMADFGADVIKVESPGEGDPYRKLNGAGYPQSNMDHHWLLDNRNKRGIVLDLKSDAGREVLYKLARGADVFVTNMPFPVRDKLCINYKDIKALNPCIIYASMTAYGEEGPEKDRTGFDSTALWARSGLMDLVRPGPDSPPARSVAGMGDHPTAVSLFAGIMMALYRRNQTGEGAHVSTSLLANGAWSNAFMAQAMLCGGEAVVRPPREQSANPIANQYRTKDGRWMQLIMINQPHKFADLVTLGGRPELADDPRFATQEARQENNEACIAALDEIFIEHDFDWWVETMTKNGILYGHVATTAELATDPQMIANKMLRPFSFAPDVMTIDSPISIKGVEKEPVRKAPDRGEHTDEVLAEAGYNAAEIAAMRKAGTVA